MREGEGVFRRNTKIADAAPLGDEHHRVFDALGKLDVAHRVAAPRPLDVGGIEEEIGKRVFLPDRGGVEAAVLADRDRPDAVLFLFVRSSGEIGVAEALAAPDGVVEADLAGRGVLADAEAPDAAAEVGEVPAGRRRREGAVRAIGDAGGARRVEGDWRERLLFASLGVEEARSPVAAVVVGAEVGAVRGREAVDEAGLEVGDDDLAVPAIVDDASKGRSGVFAAVERHLREHLRLVAVRGIELPDGSGSASRTPHAGHPVGAVGGAMQPEGRRGGQVDVRRLGIVERHTEYLANIAGGHRDALRLVQPVVALRCLAGIADVDDAADDAVEVDDGAAAVVERPGEAGDIGLARLNRFRGILGTGDPG